MPVSGQSLLDSVLASAAGAAAGGGRLSAAGVDGATRVYGPFSVAV